MKIVTSATVFRDGLGMRLSFTYSVVDEQGHIVSDNNRENRMITDNAVVTHAEEILNYAQQSLPQNSEE